MASLCQHSDHAMTFCQQSTDDWCDGSGLLYTVRTPRLDPRDPAFSYDEFDCPGCPMCEDPMTREDEGC